MSVQTKSIASTDELIRHHVMQNYCMRTFVVGIIALGVIIIGAAIGALLASSGMLPSGLNSLCHLSVIGEVNSFVMLCGGIVLFVLGAIAWGCIMQENFKEASR